MIFLHQATDFYAFLVQNANTANALAAIGSALAAFLAVVVSTITLGHQRKHDRLTVRPLAYIMVGDYDDRVYVKVANNGTGPMIIKSITVNDKPRPLYQALSDILPEGIYWTNYTADYADRSVRAGGQVVLVDLDSGSNTHVSPEKFGEARDLVRRALGNITVRVKYTDIYNKNQPIAERKLDWFHRCN
jgi:hypothetical protein